MSSRKARLAAFVVTPAVMCAVAMPADALADIWSYTTGPLQAAYDTNAYLSIENDTNTTQTVNLGIFAGGDAGVMIPAAQTYTWKSNCTTSGGCLGPAIVQGSTPDLVPAFYYTPLGATNATNVPAGGFVFSGPAGYLGDYLSADLNANTGALTSLENSAANQQTLLSSTQGQVSGIVGSVQSVRSGLTTAIQAVSTHQQITTLDSHVEALTKQVSKLTALLTPKSKKKKSKSGRETK